MLRQLGEALRPGGRLVLAFRPDAPDVPERFRDETYRFYTAEEIRTMALLAGFPDVRLVTIPEQPVLWVVAEQTA